jgi:hypothetical protein
MMKVTGRIPAVDINTKREKYTNHKLLILIIYSIKIECTLNFLCINNHHLSLEFTFVFFSNICISISFEKERENIGNFIQHHTSKPYSRHENESYICIYI